MRIKAPKACSKTGKRQAPCPGCGRRRTVHCCPPEYHVHLDDSECAGWSCSS